MNRLLCDLEARDQPPKNHNRDLYEAAYDALIAQGIVPTAPPAKDKTQTDRNLDPNSRLPNNLLARLHKHKAERPGNFMYDFLPSEDNNIVERVLCA